MVQVGHGMEKFSKGVIHVEADSGQTGSFVELSLTFLSSPAQWDRISWDLLEHIILEKGIPKYILLRSKILFLQILPFSWFG